MSKGWTMSPLTDRYSIVCCSATGYHESSGHMYFTATVGTINFLSKLHLSICLHSIIAVSYTHLDVYKRQVDIHIQNVSWSNVTTFMTYSTYENNEKRFI